MRPRRLLPTAGILAMAATLSGCVVAAIPVVAGGALLRIGTDGQSAKVRAENLFEDRPVRPTANGFAADGETMFAGPAPAPAAKPEFASRMLRADLENSAFGDFLAFAEKAAIAPADTPAPASALLADPTSLSAERKACPPGPPAILIDLDPAGRLLAAEPVLEADMALAERLEALRRSGVEIAWISGQSAAHAGALREALSSSALDPEGRDTLLLMRYPGDRKQTRREDFASTACLVAIAGDEREDFDELFDYLVNPEAALGLELLIGDGWFIVPPLSPSDQRPTP